MSYDKDRVEALTTEFREIREIPGSELNENQIKVLEEYRNMKAAFLQACILRSVRIDK